MSLFKKMLVSLGAILFCLSILLYAASQLLLLDWSSEIEFKYFVITAISLALVFLGASAILIHNLVTVRAKRFSERFKRAAAAGDVSLRLDDSGGNDELSTLAADINRMLAALELAHNAVGRIDIELNRRIREKTGQLRRKVLMMEALTDIDRELIAADDSRALQTAVCCRAAEMMQAPKALLALADPESGGRIIASVGLDNQNPRYAELERLYSPDLFMDLGWPGEGAIAFDEVTAYNHHLPELIAHENVHSLALAPLKLDQLHLGALLVFDTLPRAWSEDEVQSLGILAGQIALGIDSTRLLEAEKASRRELSSLYQLSRGLLASAPDIDTLLLMIAQTAVDTVDVTYCRIALLDDNQLQMRSAYPRRVLGQDLDVGSSEPLAGLTVVNRVIARGTPAVVATGELILSCHEREVIFFGGAKTVCLVPLKNGERTLGLLILAEAREAGREPFTARKAELAAAIGEEAVSALRRAEMFGELEQAYLQTVLSLANTIDARDSRSGGHGQLLAHMALAVGRMYGMTPAELESLHYACLLHDVGKVGIADSILQKPTGLTEREWEQMRKHPSIGEQILSPVSCLGPAARLVRHHHEHFDGSGYPDRLTGEAIPLGSRILAVVDAYCAMCEPRLYREPLSHAQAIRELDTCSGTQFDSRVVKTYIRLMESGTINVRGGGSQKHGHNQPGDTEAA